MPRAYWQPSFRGTDDGRSAAAVAACNFTGEHHPRKNLDLPDRKLLISEVVPRDICGQPGVRPPKMSPCAEKERLTKRYGDAMEESSVAPEDLYKLQGRISLEDTLGCFRQRKTLWNAPGPLRTHRLVSQRTTLIKSPNDRPLCRGYHAE